MMAGNSKKLMKVITEQINRSPMLNHATVVLGNATDKAQAKLANMQVAATEKYNTIVKQVNGSLLIQDLNATALQSSSPIPKQLMNMWRWYQEMIGLDKVELSKQNVIEVQDKLFKCQDQRRELMHALAAVSNELKDVYAEIIQTKRDDPKYVQLTILENNNLQTQNRLNQQLLILENEERDYFTQLATAIKEYHDNQTLNAQKYKYLSILASAAFAIISLTGSMIYNNKRIADVRNIIAEAQSKNESMFFKHFKSLESNTSSNLSMVMNKLGNIEGQHFFPTNVTNNSNTDDDIDMERLKKIVYYGGIALFAYYTLKTIL